MLPLPLGEGRVRVLRFMLPLPLGEGRGEGPRFMLPLPLGEGRGEGPSAAVRNSQTRSDLEAS